MKFNYGKIFLLGFGFFGVSVIWGVYNAFVPIFLSEKFGLTPVIIGFFMTLDNIAALFIQPPLGAWSDRLRTPLGRRIPFILIGAPIGALAFGLIPLAALLPLFVACTSTLLLSMALWRTPVVALMPDITPSQYRSQANGIINFMGGIGAVMSFLVGGMLYKMSPAFPFWMGSGLVIVAALLVFLFIKEPKDYIAPEYQPGVFEGFSEYLRGKRIVMLISLGAVLVLAIIFSSWLTALMLVAIWFIVFYAMFMAREPLADKDKSPIRLFLAIFFWFVGYNAVEAFFTLYAKNHLGMNEADGARLLGHLSLIFVLFALIAGLIGSRIGRKNTILIGITIMGLLLAGIYFSSAEWLTTVLGKLPVLGEIPVLSIFLMAAGAAWALININSLPMVVDMVDNVRIGAYTGLYYLFSTLAAIAGPIINGRIIEATGNNYNSSMLLAPVFFVLAFIMMLGVKRGEARPVA
ncbi:MAG: MFS transporter [Anaerolineales bacterium]|jgi:MFS family permease|nr:MFS transporter [Anaerolineales bacterium]